MIEIVVWFWGPTLLLLIAIFGLVLTRKPAKAGPGPKQGRRPSTGSG